MATPLLEAHGLAAVTSDGVSLFSGIELVLDRGLVGLVGRNGIGKSTLGRILAGEREADAGAVLRHGRTAWLPQEVCPDRDARIVDVLGVAGELSALNRIRAGLCEQADFDAIGERWDLETTLAGWLSRFGLEHLTLDSPAGRCSGGELTRLALIRLLLAEPELLILDEPTNHLDAAGRRSLMEFLRAWPGGALVISHDRELLGQAGRILELSSLGLAVYPGPWSAYDELKRQERAAAEHRHDVAHAERKEQERRRQMALERQQRRQGRGRKERREANQCKVVLDFREQGSQATSARLRRQHDDRVEEAAQRASRAREALERITPVALTVAPLSVPSGRRMLSVTDVSMGFGGRVLFERLSFELLGSQRLAVRGANGCGKSVLLGLVCGALQPGSGRIEVRAPVVMLDQHQSLLDDHGTALENFQRLAPGLSEAEYRTRLARLGLAAEHVNRPVAVLSGGERLKLALACILLGPEPPPLLLLDEPTNHQDLESVAALEGALREYAGAMMVVSHDEHFLANIGITHELRLDARPAGGVVRVEQVGGNKQD